MSIYDRVCWGGVEEKHNAFLSIFQIFQGFDGSLGNNLSAIVLILWIEQVYLSLMVLGV